jgi:hypothetical protein
VNLVMNVRVPQTVGKLLSGSSSGFSRKSEI